jgi:hypothetical protein
MPTGTDADAGAQNTCSDTSAPGGTTSDCKAKKVVTISWEKNETWCSEDGPISGTTLNYADGENLSIAVTDHSDGSAVTTLQAAVSGNSFRNVWNVIDVLPSGGPSWNPRRPLDGATGGVTTPTPMDVRFIPNVKRDRKSHSCQYDRTEPGATTSNKVSVECRFDLESVNYLLTIYGVLKYVRGWGKYRLQLGDATLTGGFVLFKGTTSEATNHWGKKDPATGKFQYWDGSAWQTAPATWTPDDSNYFGIPFYKSGSSWTCRDDSSLTWPEPLSDWPTDKYQGDGNVTDTTLAKWVTNIQTRWTDKFDIKRVECKSTKSECCRYKTLCVANFQEVDSYGSGVIIVAYEDVRSDAGLWSMGDAREGLAPHEFGHLLGAPDEYGGVATTQLGVSDGDGLNNGIDDDCLMGKGLKEPKKRHYKGICEMLALLVSDQFGKTYTYKAVDKGANLASPPGTPATPDSGSGGSGALIGAIIGGVVGAVAGALIGFLASGGNPAAAALGAAAGAVAGALIGAGIGSLF